jgi:hypothetical protein
MAPDPAQLPGAGGCGVAEHGVLAGGKHGRHPPAFDSQCGVSDRVHPAMDRVQSAGGNAAVDRTVVDARGQQLRSGDDSVLAGRERGDQRIRGAFAPHIGG